MPKVHTVSPSEAEQRFDALYGVCLQVGQNMGVDIEREGARCMPQLFGDDLSRNPGRKCQGTVSERRPEKNRSENTQYMNGRELRGYKQKGRRSEVRQLRC